MEECREKKVFWVESTNDTSSKKITSFLERMKIKNEQEKTPTWKVECFDRSELSEISTLEGVEIEEDAKVELIGDLSKEERGFFHISCSFYLPKGQPHPFREEMLEELRGERDTDTHVLS